MQGVGDCADGRGLRRAGMTGRQDDQAPCALPDLDPDRRVAGNRAIGQVMTLVMNRRKGTRDRGGSNDRLADRALRQHHAVPRDDIGRDDVHREFRLLQIAIRDVIVDQLADAVMGNEEVAAPEKPKQRSPGDREHVVPPQAAPDMLEFKDTPERGIACIVGAVDGADA